MSRGSGLGVETLAGSSSFAAEAESLNPFKFLFIDCGFMAKPLAVETHELPPRKCISRQREPTRGLLQLPAGLQTGGLPGCAAPCSCTQVSPLGCNGLSPPRGQGDPWVLVAVSGKQAPLAFWVPPQIPLGVPRPQAVAHWAGVKGLSVIDPQSTESAAPEDFLPSNQWKCGYQENVFDLDKCFSDVNRAGVGGRGDKERAEWRQAAAQRLRDERG